MRPHHLFFCFLVSALALLAAVPSSRAAQITLEVPQLWQHRDADWFFCDLCMGFGPHDPLHAPLPPWGEDCHHCSATCAPASVMMVFRYREIPGCPCTQECFYNRYKFLDGELPGDFIFQTHGVGMQDIEIIDAYRDALGEVHIFTNDVAGDPYPPMTSWVMRQMIGMGTSILWIDRDGLPGEYMSQEVYNAMLLRGAGHVKVLAGYDDRDTYCMLEDDLVLVYDPWPSPDDCPYPKSPYWAPLDQVLGASESDRFLTDRWGGAAVAEADPPGTATAWSNARRLVRDESDGSHNLLYASGGHIYFTKSVRPYESAAWTPPIQVDLGELPLTSTDPTLALCPNTQGYSRLHAVWAQALAPAGPFDLFWSESGDGGRSWTFPAPVHVSPFEQSRRPSLDVDGEGGLHLVWDETGLEMGREILYSTRPAAGDTWSLPRNISRSPIHDSSFPSLATSYDGTEWDDPPIPARSVHIAWAERTSMPPVHSTIVYRIWDPVAGWQPQLEFPPEEATSGIGGTTPSLIVGPDRSAKLVWTTSQEDPAAIPTEPSDIFFAERIAGSWTIPRQVSAPSGPLDRPSVAPTIAFANGPFCQCLHATWEEWDPLAGGTIWVAIRSGLSPDWTAHTPVTYLPGGARMFPTLAAKNGLDFTKGYDLVWTEPSDHFNFTVRFLGTSRGNPFAASVDSPVARGITRLRAWPNPFGDRIEFSGPASQRGGDLQILDLRGRRVRILDGTGTPFRWVWDGRDASGREVPQGVYLVRTGSEPTALRILRLR